MGFPHSPGPKPGPLVSVRVPLQSGSATRRAVDALQRSTGASAPPRWRAWRPTCRGFRGSAPRTAPGSDDRPGRHPGSSTGTAATTPAPTGTALAARCSAPPRGAGRRDHLRADRGAGRLSIEVVESNVDPCWSPPTPRGAWAVLRYAREVAFATAEVTPGRRGPAAPGTPGWRRWSWTPCCAPRPTRPSLPRERPRLGRAWTSPWSWARSPRSAPRPTSSRRYAESPGPRTWRRCVRCRASVWSCCWAASPTTAPPPRWWWTVRRRARRGRPAGRGPGRAPRLRPGGPVCAPVATGWPRHRGRCEQRPAERRWRRRPCRRHMVDQRVPALVHARGTLIETLAAYSATARRSRRPRARSSCTPTRSATACARSPDVPATPPGRPRRVHAPDRPRARPPVRRGISGLCRLPTKQRPQIRARRGDHDPSGRHSCRCARHRRSGQGAQTPDSSRLAGGRHVRVALRVALGVAGSTWRITAQRPTPTPSGHPDRPAAAGGHRPGRRPERFPHPETPSTRSARSPATVSAARRRRRGPRHHRRAGDGPGARARGDGRGGGDAAPTGMTAILGDPWRSSPRSRARADPGQRQRSRPDRGRRTLEQLKALAGDPPAKARLMPLSVAGAFHTEHMAPRSGTWPGWRSRSLSTTRGSRSSPTRTAASSTTAPRCSAGSWARSPNPCARTSASRRCPTSASPASWRCPRPAP